MGLGNTISMGIAKGINAAKERPLAAAFVAALQISAAYDQFQYEAAHNVPENFEIGDVVSDIILGNILDFGPLSQHWSRSFDPDSPCTNRDQVFNNSIEWAKEKDPSGVSEFAEIFVRFSHLSSLPGAEIGSFAYETYDTAMKLMYDKEEREPGLCAGLE